MKSKKLVFLDTECYQNYFLVCFKSDKLTKYYELHENLELNREDIKKILKGYTTVGFNSNNYDLPMLAHAIDIRSTNETLKQLSDYIITTKDLKKLWVIFEKFKIPYRNKQFNHIDLFNVAPKIDSEYKVGLKVYGSRLHTKTLQDLPIEPDAIIRPDQHELLRKYCENDVIVTKELYQAIKKEIDLRIEMSAKEDIDLRSSSDSQIAEKLVRKQFNISNPINKILYRTKGFNYIAPDFIKLENDAWLNVLKTTEFLCNENGYINKPENVSTSFKIEEVEYSVGIGGIHSVNDSEAHTTKDDEYILDVDFTSYYPSIILHNGYYPEKLGKEFLDFYKHIYKERIAAKQNKDTLKAEVYKIILNGSFGKTASVWSCMYDPRTMLNITLTGQLCILMLVEEINKIGCKVISANTDGVTFKGKLANLDSNIQAIKHWQKITGMELEFVKYKAIYHESVNSYIAIKEDGSLKCKGVYADQGLKKNPINSVCVEAVCNYIKDNKPLRETLLENKHDIRKFLVVRKAATGAYWKGEYLGKTVRWYYGKDGYPLEYKAKKTGNFNRVAGSEGAIPLMDLENFSIPVDIDVYEEIAKKMLINLGVNV